MRAYVKVVGSEREPRTVLRDLGAADRANSRAMNPVEAEHAAEATILGISANAPATVDDEPRLRVARQRAGHDANAHRRRAARRTRNREHDSPITTAGDRVQDRPLSAVSGASTCSSRNSNRRFASDAPTTPCTRAKIFPSELAGDMRLAAISVREDPRDAFCSERFASFEALPAGAVVGTSSLRRRVAAGTRCVPTFATKTFEATSTRVCANCAKAVRCGGARDGRLEPSRTRAAHTVAFDVDVVVPAVAQGALAIGDARRRRRPCAASCARRSTMPMPNFAFAANVRRCARCAPAAMPPSAFTLAFANGLMTVAAAYAAADTKVVLRERRNALARRIDGVDAAGAVGAEVSRLPLIAGRIGERRYCRARKNGPAGSPKRCGPAGSRSWNCGRGTPARNPAERTGHGAFSVERIGGRGRALSRQPSPDLDPPGDRRGNGTGIGARGAGGRLRTRRRLERAFDRSVRRAGSRAGSRLPVMAVRPRRLRRGEAIRSLVREHDVTVDHLVAPLFVVERPSDVGPIASMPGIARVDAGGAVREARELLALGVRSVLLFGIPAHKDAVASSNYDPGGIVQTSDARHQSRRAGDARDCRSLQLRIHRPRALRHSRRARRRRQRRDARTARPHGA